MRESVYQSHLIVRLRHEFPGCFILKNDSGYMPGVPDLSIFLRDKWAMLEVKNSKNASEQPNQRYYVNLLNVMSFAVFIYPSNEEEVFRGLHQIFASADSEQARPAQPK
jgi:hypothetical protein